jgi:tRNA-specific 2-thiouridylase
MRILVGLSGGVDSAVAALLLKQQGHEIIGATMSIWGKGDSIVPQGGSCKDACYGPNEKEDIEQAKNIAEFLGIPYYVFDCVDQYEKIVLENFKEEYLSGRTPNPCIWCNSLIKFDVLPFVAKQAGLEFDKFATGHYAKVEYDESKNRYALRKGINPKKDQSYFIYRLKQRQLENILLPLGGYTKEEIRQIAKDNGLNVHDKPDTQDFYSGDYNELLEVSEKEGNIVDLNGNVLGVHKGIWNYTVGQRKGIGIAAPNPLYVLSLNKEKNEVVVGEEDATLKKSLIADDLNWVSVEKLQEPTQVTAKIRSAQTPVEVLIIPLGDSVQVEFENMQKSITPGQSIVFYDDDLVLGGGIIEKVF